MGNSCLEYEIKQPKEYGLEIMHHDGNMEAWFDVCFFRRKKNVNIEPKLPSSQQVKSAKTLFFNISRYVLHWSASDVIGHLSDMELKNLCLMKVTDKCFSPDFTMSYRKKMDNILECLYPDKCESYRMKRIKQAWNEVKKGERKWSAQLSGKKRISRKEVFSLFEVFLQENFIYANIEELYRKFSDSAYINGLLKKEHLYDVTKSYFVFPIDLLHEYLRMVDMENLRMYRDEDEIPANENDFLYMTYRCHSVVADAK